MPCTGGATPRHRVHAAEASLRGVPQILRNDRELGVLVRDPLRLGPLHAPAALASGNADPLRLVPGEAAKVPLVAQHCPDRRVAPAVAFLVATPAIVRRRESLLIERRRDLLQRRAVGEEAEHPYDQRRLDGLDHGTLPGVLGVGRVLFGDRRVTVASATGPETAKGTPFKPAVRLGAHELKERVVDQRHRAEGEPRAGAIRGQAGRHVDHLHVRRGEVAEHDLPRVSEVARQPGEIVDQDRSERRATSRARRGEQALHLCALDVGARDRGILVLGDDAVPPARCIGSAAANLIVNRTRVLTVRRKPRVDRNRDSVLSRPRHQAAPFRRENGPARPRTRGRRRAQRSRPRARVYPTAPATPIRDRQLAQRPHGERPVRLRGRGLCFALRQRKLPPRRPEIRLANRRHCRVNPRPRQRQQPSILGQTSDENRQPPSRLRSRRAHDAVGATSVRVQYRVTSAARASLR